MADIYVNSDELKLIATGMKTKAANIMEAYQNEASSAILMGGECLQISGLDTTTLLNSFNKIFTNINTRISTLADFLSTTVANEYDSTTASITNEFNNNFANEIAGILGISVGASKVTNNSGIAIPWQKGEELDPGFSQPSTPSTRDNSNALSNAENRTNYDGNKRKDPEYSYRNNPSIGNSKPGISSPTPGVSNTSAGGSISTTTPLPGNTTLTPGTNNDANIDPDMSYPNYGNMKNLIDSRIKINPVKRPIYELPVQPKPKPEIMSTNNVLR